MPKMFHELGFKVGVEVGVFEGDLTKCLLHYIPELKLYGVDIWQKYDNYRENVITDVIDNAYLLAQKNVKGYDCELIKDWSSEAVRRFEDESLDFVYIDGNHTLEYAIQDISLWAKKVRKGGIVSGHDYQDWSNSNRWSNMQVKEAVDTWTKVKRIHPWFVTVNNSSNSWLYVK